MSRQVDDVHRVESRIGRKLANAIFGTSALVVTLACAVFAFQEVYHHRADTDHQIDMLSGAIAINLGDAMRFEDAKTAELVLSAASAAPELELIAAYTPNGERFAWYSREALEPARTLDIEDEADRDTVESSVLITTRDIVSDGRHWGTMLVHWNMEAMWDRLSDTAVLALVLLGLAQIVSSQFAKRLHALVGNPLEALAAEAHDLSNLANFDGGSGGSDEIQVLRRALESMSKMQVVVGAVDDNTREIAQISHSLRHVSAAMQDDAATELQAADECSTSMARFATSSREISDAVGRLAQRYQETTTAIHATSESIGEITNEMNGLARSIERVASGTHESAASAHQIAVAMQGIREATTRVSELASNFTQTVADVELRATETASLSDRSNVSAEKGAQAVEQTVHAMGEVDESFAEMSATVGDLVQRCDEIGESLAVIESIADETKLLALNAAIIAAQSGEHGRSFAVVAEGIRLLSDRSIASARVIHDSLQSLHESAAQATRTVGEGGEKVARGVACSAEATDVLGEILEATSEAAEQVRKISESTREQTRDIGIVQEGLIEVGALIEGSSHAAHEQERVGQDMAQAMGTMNEASRAIESLLARQKSETDVVADAAESVNTDLTAIRSGTDAQAHEGGRVREQLEVFSETTKAATRRAASVHDLVEVLVSQAGRLRVHVQGGEPPEQES